MNSDTTIPIFVSDGNFINPLRLGDLYKHHYTGSALVWWWLLPVLCQAITRTSVALTHCGLMMPYGGIDLHQHWLKYLNQCWFIIIKVLWHSFEDCFSTYASAINHSNKFWNWLSKILYGSPRGQWVNVRWASNDALRLNFNQHPNFCYHKSAFGNLI